jgi:ribosomal protein S18 acetylase RimI-like enzyme
MLSKMKIRNATLEDLSKLATVEAKCFPPSEAATKESLKKRLMVYPGHFWLIEENDEIIGFINGMVSNKDVICDEMFEDERLHDEAGDWQMIFGVNTCPEHRRKGYAAKIMEQVILDAKSQNRKGCVLTCKSELLHYYQKFGFQNLGISKSIHGGAVWYDMRLTF